MSQHISPSTQPHGIAHMIRMWELSRSTFYALRLRRDPLAASAQRGREWLVERLGFRRRSRVRYLLSGSQFDYTRRAVQESWAGTHVGCSHCDDDPEARRVVRQRGRRDQRQRVRGLTVSLAGGLVLVASGFLLMPSTRWLEHGIWTAGWPDAAWVLWRQRLRPS